ncbi:membrane protein [Arthrobacter phage Shambre1]|uniref:Membrane protein n=1 Tax=Arthrobacter phage Shambre1 TaxID=2927284 RepID=A0A977PRV2_9CAUD|nr:membrane protein [Arthrobacter phage Shambre1]UXE04783.1 membrane protein [Arthrobacter phage Shambre1]
MNPDDVWALAGWWAAGGAGLGIVVAWIRRPRPEPKTAPGGPLGWAVWEATCAIESLKTSIATGTADQVHDNLNQAVVATIRLEHELRDRERVTQHDKQE